MLTKQKPIVALALSFTLSGILLGQPSAVNADDQYIRLFLQGQQQTQSTAPISVGETVTGTLDASDETLPDGRPVDTYTFDAPAGQSYVITVNSAVLPALSLIGLGSAGVQAANVFAAGFQVQYSGTLSVAGVHTILVTSADSSIPNGEYELSLKSGTGGPGPGDGDCDNAGTFDNPVNIELNERLNCELESGGDQFESGRIIKAFNFNSTGGTTVTISATSSVFRPAIYIPDPDDPTSGQWIGRFDSYTLTFPSGNNEFVVSSENPGEVGAFTVVIENGGSTLSQAYQFDAIPPNGLK